MQWLTGNCTEVCNVKLEWRRRFSRIQILIGACGANYRLGQLELLPLEFSLN